MNGPFDLKNYKNLKKIAPNLRQFIQDVKKNKCKPGIKDCVMMKPKRYDQTPVPNLPMKAKQKFKQRVYETSDSDSDSSSEW